ncbi:MAG: hypothetical protein JW982_08295 [Spirochaetes bacterium]|nr:hypothetical protein [Spirochaetota bacterium]
MQFLFKYCFIISIIVSLNLSAQPSKPGDFRIKSLDNSSAGSIIKAVLKLKTVDYNFMFIEFYDTENIDIRFDLTDYYKKRKYKTYRRLENIHPGAEYEVEFKLLNVDEKTGYIDAEIIEYLPLFIEKLP